MRALLLPRPAAWRHTDAREGFEVAFVSARGAGTLVEGHTSACEAGVAWSVEYSIELDRPGASLAARVVSHTSGGRRSVSLAHDGSGNWTVDGVARPELRGCFDVDLEASALTNAFPVHRLALAVGQESSAPAAYVRAEGCRVERLEQFYRRLEDDDGRPRYDYRSPAFDFQCVLVYDEFGFVLDYPGIAERVL